MKAELAIYPYPTLKCNETVQNVKSPQAPKFLKGRE